MDSIDDFGDDVAFDPERDYSIFSTEKEVPESDKLTNAFLFKPYGTENSRAFKDQGGIILSPSGITKFFNNSKEWYQDRTGVPSFDGNTATVLGNAIHAYIESVFAGYPVSRSEVEYWIDQKYALNVKVDKAEVLKHFTNMANAWFKDFYTAEGSKRPDYIEVEMEHMETTPEDPLQIGTFGTADAIYGSILVDWKTCSTKPKGIGNYKYQLMQYARALKKLGVTVDTIKIVYIQKPTKTIGARIYQFSHKITTQDWLETEWYTEVMINSLLLVKKNPGIVDLVFRENPTALW